VEELTPEDGLEYQDFEEVYTALDMNEVMLVKSLFEGHGIKYVAQGDNHFKSSGTIMGNYGIPVKFIVAKEQVSEAQELLKQGRQ
jgi:hypothetical protein